MFGQQLLRTPPASAAQRAVARHAAGLSLRMGKGNPDISSPKGIIFVTDFIRPVIRALASRRGAVDLPSIMIGVAVVAILTGGILATVFGAIPWAQDSSAKQNITAVRTAEGMAVKTEGRFLDTEAMKKAGYLKSTGGLGIVTNGRDGDKGCYLVAVQSKSGKMFYGTDAMDEPAELKNGTKNPCLLGAQIQDAISTAGGKVVAGTDAYKVTRAGGNDERVSSLPSSFSGTHAPVTGLDGKSITDMAIGTQHSCVIANNEPWCWGLKSAHRLGNKDAGAGYAAGAVKASLSKLPAGKRLTNLSSYWATTCLIADEKPYCWGNNNAGNIDPANYSTATSFSEPTLVPGMATRKVTDLSSGYNNTCAVSDGAAWCWGRNSWGVNGNGVNDGSTATYQNPAKIAGALANKTVTAVEVGRYNACAVADGSLYCWGASSMGQLPTNGATSATPVKIAGLPKGGNVTDITIGNTNICAVVSGNLWCWGNNAQGQIGNGTLETVKKPYLVKGALQGKTVESVSAGYSGFTCAVASGDAYCWGTNEYGQTGTGATTTLKLPAKVPVAANQRVVLAKSGDYNSFLATVTR